MDQIRVSCSEETKQFTRTIEDILDKIALEVLEDSANVIHIIIMFRNILVFHKHIVTVLSPPLMTYNL